MIEPALLLMGAPAMAFAPVSSSETPCRSLCRHLSAAAGLFLGSKELVFVAGAAGSAVARDEVLRLIRNQGGGLTHAPVGFPAAICWGCRPLVHLAFPRYVAFCALPRFPTSGRDKRRPFSR